MLRRLTILAVALAAAGTTMSPPAYAVGHVICVGSPVGTCDEHQSTIHLAIEAATANGQQNTILVGPGTYTEAPWFMDSTTHVVALRGSGEGATTLTIPADAAIQTYLRTNQVSIQNLTIAMKGAGSSGDRALDLSASPVDHVTVTGAGASNVIGIFGRTPSTLSHITVQLPPGASNTGVASDGGITFSDSTITADYGYTHSGPNTTDTLSRVSIRATRHGIGTDSGDVDVDDTLINLGTSAGAKGIRVENTNNSTSTKTITANHVTIVGGGEGSYGVYAYAATPTALQHATVLLGNSIIRGPATDLYAIAGNDGAQGGTSVATIGILYSDWHSQSAVSQAHGTASIAVGAGRLDVAPGFRDPVHGNYRLAAGSPVIDKGMPGTAAPTLDLGRNARIQDGNRDGTAVRDLGAYEASPDTTAANTAITSHPRRTTTKRRVAFGFAANELSATFQCRLDKKPWSSCTSPRSYRVTKGWHTFKVRAVDAARNVDPTPAKFRFHRV